MHWGAKHGRKEMIKLVANSGMDINTRSHAGYTPLHIAAMHNRESIMKFLTSEYEADVNIRDYSGKRPHQYLANTEPTYLQRVLPNIQMGHLEKFEPEKRSKFNTLRASFRALRTWGSTESIPKKRSVSTGVLVSSPMMRPKSVHMEHHRSFTPETSPKIQHRPLSTVDFDQFRMPPPVPTHVKRARKNVFGAVEIHKSGSDSNILESSTFI
ncbi:ankyrin repeat domain-containing protein SOWAHD-like isoform X2 [Anneissia japonica]|uniref:ankyrin repeat domain-containing protein SOWAHD-like isoform X2 n=1 Tax=Anneissia japonica TaxID=1529436 RepID=UPI0014258B73|nr:ankyrin repeat domain-containing protein SOWAHD-like isoform X2 [Anneissia japonica]